jgi:alkylation response protein AidB-like acyl-CoA dehydrogenase
MMHEETIDGQRLIDQETYRDRLMQLQARMLSMKFNGMRILTHTLKNEEPGLPGWIVKLQGCELNHQMAAMAIDIMGELGILYDDSPYLRNAGFWQQRYMMDLGLIIGGGTAQIQKNMIGERALGLPKEPKQEQRQSG